MRPALAAAFLPLATTAYALAPLHKSRPGRAIPPSLHADDLHHAQRPILDTPGPAMPPSPGPDDNSQPPPSSDPPAAGGPGTVILSDVMGRDRSINIFAGLVRDVEGVSKRLDDVAQNSTVLAPLNSAMERLPRKPWEDPEEYDKLGAAAYEGDEGWERAQRNIRRFVEAHIVPQNPWREGEKVQAMVGGEVWWEEKDGAKVVSICCQRTENGLILTDGWQIQPGDIEVASIASSVQNGQVVSVTFPSYLLSPLCAVC